GFLDVESVVFSVILTVITVIALICWSLSVKGEHGEIQDLYGPSLSNPMRILVFGLFNAIMEEIEFRGLMIASLYPNPIQESEAGYPLSFSKILASSEGVIAVSIQCILFGFDHALNGFPTGPSGFVLSAGWAFALGLLRLKSNGIALTYIIHVIADVTIGFLIRASAKPSKKWA
ncbi:hypothetical protein AAMO2058_000359900, partial [Amorphochlora amoebiformis]